MKRTQKLVTWSIVILVVLVVLLMLMSNLRRSSRVVLPDTSTSEGEYLWNGGSSTSEITVSASGGWSRTDRTLPDGQTRHAITNGETTYIWYNSETDVFTGPAGEISPDAEQTIPTYEDVLALAPEQIAQADYRMVSDVRCIYVETAEDDWGYVQRYWVSVDTGLLAVAERLQDGETVYRMAALTVDETAPDAKTFTLPDGTALI